MTQNSFNKPVILTPNVDMKGLGIFKSEEDTVVVSVYRLEGRSTYTYAINGSCQSVSRCTPFECWELLSETLGACLVTVPRKWFNKEYKSEIKEAKEK